MSPAVICSGTVSSRSQAAGALLSGRAPASACVTRFGDRGRLKVLLLLHFYIPTETRLRPPLQCCRKYYRCFSLSLPYGQTSAWKASTSGCMRSVGLSVVVQWIYLSIVRQSSGSDAHTWPIMSRDAVDEERGPNIRGRKRVRTPTSLTTSWSSTRSMCNFPVALHDIPP